MVVDLWQLVITRVRVECLGPVRTVGHYQVFHNGMPTDLTGWTAEPGGPGDNQHMGNDRRIEAGTYPLLTHQGEHYLTIGYGFFKPKPALELGKTGSRKSILFHPASGFLSSLGCINAAGPLFNVWSRMSFIDSRKRVIEIIDDLSHFLGDAFPKENGMPIPHATIILKGEPR
jgi:hypothetical protein